MEAPLVGGLGFQDNKRKAAMHYSPKHTIVEPTARAMNCCPPTANVIGEVLMVAFQRDAPQRFAVPLVHGDEVAAGAAKVPPYD